MFEINYKILKTNQQLLKRFQNCTTAFDVIEICETVFSVFENHTTALKISKISNTLKF